MLSSNLHCRFCPPLDAHFLSYPPSILRLHHLAASLALPLRSALSSCALFCRFFLKTWSLFSGSARPCPSSSSSFSHGHLGATPPSPSPVAPLCRSSALPVRSLVPPPSSFLRPVSSSCRPLFCSSLLVPLLFRLLSLSSRCRCPRGVAASLLARCWLRLPPRRRASTTHSAVRHFPCCRHQLVTPHPNRRTRRHRTRVRNAPEHDTAASASLRRLLLPSRPSPSISPVAPSLRPSWRGRAARASLLLRRGLPGSTRRNLHSS